MFEIAICSSVFSPEINIVAYETYLFSGDLFEREEDIADPSLWQYVAGSDDPEKQRQNRNKILQIADWIVPGHGPMFKVTEEMKSSGK
jgi:glyoxylase-like metal-dependent hydrolase (beta-lactamase superfamily II)